MHRALQGVVSCTGWTCRCLLDILLHMLVPHPLSVALEAAASCSGSHGLFICPGCIVIASVPRLTGLSMMQGSSSPLSPPVSSSGLMASKHGSVSPPDSLTAVYSISKAVSAKPFSIQHPAEGMKAAQSHDHALPWLDVTASDAAQQSVARDVARGPGGRTDDTPTQLDLQNGQLTASPFAERTGPSASHEWAFKTSQSLSLLDM